MALFERLRQMFGGGNAALGGSSTCTTYPCHINTSNMPFPVVLSIPWFTTSPGNRKCYAPNGTDGSVPDTDIPGMAAMDFTNLSLSDRFTWLVSHDNWGYPTGALPGYQTQLCGPQGPYSAMIYPCVNSTFQVGAPFFRIDPNSDTCYATGTNLPCLNPPDATMPLYGNAVFSSGYNSYDAVEKWWKSCVPPNNACIPLAGNCGGNPPSVPTCTDCTTNPPTPAGCTGCSAPPPPPLCTDCSTDPPTPSGCTGCPPQCTNCSGTPSPAGCVGCTAVGSCTSCDPALPLGCTLASGQCAPTVCKGLECIFGKQPWYIWALTIGILLVGGYMLYSSHKSKTTAAAVTASPPHK